VGKVTIKVSPMKQSAVIFSRKSTGNANKALNDDFLIKRYADEALNADNKIVAMKQ
jgi:hypothetical protein